MLTGCGWQRGDTGGGSSEEEREDEGDDKRRNRKEGRGSAKDAIVIVCRTRLRSDGGGGKSDRGRDFKARGSGETRSGSGCSSTASRELKLRASSTGIADSSCARIVVLGTRDRLTNTFCCAGCADIVGGAIIAIIARETSVEAFGSVAESGAIAAQAAGALTVAIDAKGRKGGTASGLGIARDAGASGIKGSTKENAATVNTVCARTSRGIPCGRGRCGLTSVASCDRDGDGERSGRAVDVAVKGDEGAVGSDVRDGGREG